jgi:hypothetical protein
MHLRRHHRIAVDLKGLTHLFVRRQSVSTFLAPFDMATYVGCFVRRQLLVEPGD